MRQTPEPTPRSTRWVDARPGLPHEPGETAIVLARVRLEGEPGATCDMLARLLGALLADELMDHRTKLARYSVTDVTDGDIPVSGLLDVERRDG